MILVHFPSKQLYILNSYTDFIFGGIIEEQRLTLMAGLRRIAGSGRGPIKGEKGLCQFLEF